MPRSLPVPSAARLHPGHSWPGFRRAVQALPSVLLAMGTWAVAPAAWAAPETYRIDPVHTRVLFAISHAGYSQALGTVSGSTGTLQFDADDWRSARVDVTVPIARLDLGDAKWNAATLARNLVDGEQFPTARFVSTSVTAPTDRAPARITGQLTLHGVTREVVLDATLNQVARYPLPPFRRTVGFSATTQLSRAAFGIAAWPSVIGDLVTLRIEAEAARGGDAAQIGAVDAGAVDAGTPAAEGTAVPAPGRRAGGAEPPEPTDGNAPPAPPHPSQDMP